MISQKGEKEDMEMCLSISHNWWLQCPHVTSTQVSKKMPKVSK